MIATHESPRVKLTTGLGMKDDLTNRIAGSITAQGGFPLVVKVSNLLRPHGMDVIAKFFLAVNELRRLERMPPFLG